MNQKNFNKNITCTQIEDATESTIQQDRNIFLSYKFEIVDDENIYSISFKGNLTEEEIQAMLESIQNCLYEKISDAIQMYMEQHNISYSDFVSAKKPLDHSKAIKLAKLLLQSSSYSDFDSYFGNADICYLIADHQKWTAENHCQGCYLALKRTFSECKNLYLYHIIGQTFSYNETTGNESGYFVIRKNRNDVASASEPVLPTFGCVNLMGLLLDINNITTLTQTRQIGIK